MKKSIVAVAIISLILGVVWASPITYVDILGRAPSRWNTYIAQIIDTTGNGLAVIATIQSSDGNEMRMHEGQYPVTIDYAHEKIHDGEMFETCTINVSVANNGYASTYFKPTKETHLVGRVSAEGKSYVLLLENPTVSMGSSATWMNTNRTSINTFSGISSYNVTVTNVGTKLTCELLTGGTGPQSVGGSATRQIEWVCAPNVGYMIRVQNVSGQSKDININLIAYQED